MAICFGSEPFRGPATQLASGVGVVKSLDTRPSVTPRGGGGLEPSAGWRRSCRSSCKPATWMGEGVRLGRRSRRHRDAAAVR